MEHEDENETFSKLYGIPLSWARQLAEFGGGELSAYWQKVLDSHEIPYERTHHLPRRSLWRQKQERPARKNPRDPK